MGRPIYTYCEEHGPDFMHRVAGRWACRRCGRLDVPERPHLRWHRLELEDRYRAFDHGIELRVWREGWGHWRWDAFSVGHCFGMGTERSCFDAMIAAERSCR